MRPKSKADVFIFLAVVTGLPWTLAMAAFFTESPEAWVVPGALFGLVMAAYGTPRLVGVTRSISFADKETFVSQLNVACAEIGYQPKGHVGDFLSYEATGDSSFTVGPIKMAPASYLALGAQLAASQATLIGPNSAVTDVASKLSGTGG